ncbi:hypothetical protein QM012_006899 [Aureobasidium pullulans]|uniref:Uncharacterized protein n=1 Tax=Aureobasidium pullulans TaxID=5580 RepID=A0ABR0TQF0_AURPU
MPPLSQSQTIRRRRLAKHIDRNGEIMPTPYASCRTSNRTCRVDLRSGRYSECVRRARKCDLVVTKAEFDRLSKMRKKAEKELEAAEEEEDRITEKLRVQQARIRRLRKQLRQAETREGEAVERELASIKEAEQLERDIMSGLNMFPADLPECSTFAFDDRLAISPGQWADLVDVS